MIEIKDYTMFNKENTINILKTNVERFLRFSKNDLYPELIEKVMDKSFLFDMVGVQPMLGPVSLIQIKHEEEFTPQQILFGDDVKSTMAIEAKSQKLSYITDSDDLKNGKISLDDIALNIADEIDLSVIGKIFANSSDISTVDEMYKIEDEIYRIFNSDILQTSDTSNRWIVVSDDVFSELSSSSLFRYGPPTRCQDFQFVGKLEDIDVYVNNLLPDKSSVLLGYKQDNILDGFIFCPYLIHVVDQLIHPTTFKEFVSYMFRSGYFNNRNDPVGGYFRPKYDKEYYGKIVIL